MADKVDTRPLASTDRQIKNKTKRKLLKVFLSSK